MDHCGYNRQSGFKRYHPTLQSLLRSPVPDGAEQTIPIDHVGLFSFCTGTWMTGLLWNIFRKGSSAVVRYRCPPVDSCCYNVKRLERLWKEELDDSRGHASLNRAVQKFVRTRQGVMLGLFTVAQFIRFSTPVFFIYKLMEFVSNPDIPRTEGLQYVLALLTIDGLSMFFFSFLWNINSRTAVRLRSALLGLVFRKVVWLQGLGDRSVGEIINVFANDAARILEYIVIGQLWIAGTIVSIACMAYIISVIGLPALTGLSVYLFFYLVQFLAGRLNGYYRKKILANSDQRVRQMNEILMNIKVIKLYAWEEPFEEVITGIRKKERRFLEKMLFLQSVMSSFTNAIPNMAAIVTFLTCFAMGYDLSPSKAFPVLGAFIISRSGLMILSTGVAKIAEFHAAIARMQSILLMDNTMTKVPRATPRDSTHAVCLIGASFGWTYSQVPRQSGHQKRSGPSEEDNVLNGKESLDHNATPCTLVGIDLIVPKGRLVGVCGTVGSGKSSLISAILGQMPLLRGTLAIDGSCAYVAQQAWMINATVRENILFGTRHDAKRYQDVLKCCGLMDDLDCLEAGDRTEIGERGVNLSGGQKQRISLARAVYSDRDLCLLDDPLSAVDPRVGTQIFRHCIKTALASKTVIFVSHQIQYLSHCDYIVVMRDGRIAEQGNPVDLVNFGGEYAALSRAHQEQQAPQGRQQASGTSHEGFVAIGSRSNLGLDVRPADNKREQKGNTNPEEEVFTDGFSRATADEKMITGSGTISADTYWTYVGAMGGSPVAVAVVLVAGASTCVASFSSWWLSIMLQSRSFTAPPPGGVVTPAEQMSNTSTNETVLPPLDSSRDEDSTTTALHMDSLIYGCFLLAIMAATCLKAFVFVKGTLRASTVLHGDMLHKVLHSPLRFFEMVPSGRTMNLFSKDQDEVDTVLPTVMDVALNLLWLIGISLLIIVLILPWFLVPLVLIAALYCLAAAVFQAAQRELKRAENASRSPLFGHVTGTVQGLGTIHAYAREADFERRFERLQDDNTSVQLLLMMAPRWLSLRLDILAVVTMTVTATFVVLTRGLLSPAFAGLALTTSFQLSGIIHYLVRGVAEMMARFTNVERIVHYCKDLECEEEEPPQLRVTASDGVFPRDWPSAGRIRFENVTMRYREGLPFALSDVSFAVEPGEKVGIVGRTGSGKSSLGAVLFRLVEPHGGKVSIDGVNVASVALRDLRSRLSMIPQDPVLFIGTVRYNLDPFQQFADEDIWSVLERTHLKEKISGFDRQLLAPVVENGENFSVGERQLLCLARALLQQSRIIMLDEATASMDARTDDLVQEILRDAFAGCTVLTITHRIHTVVGYDKIMVLCGGKIKETGCPAQLMADPKSLFRMLLDTVDS